MRITLNKVRLSLSVIILFAFVETYAQELEEKIEDHITYNSSMDTDNIYVELSTADRPTMLSMLHRGLFVYFDVKGKKKKNVSVQYPSEVKLPQRGRDGKEGNSDEFEEDEKQGPDILEVIEEMPKMAKYNNLDFEEDFHLDLNNLGISITYNYEVEEKLLRYELKMPKQYIADNEIDFSKFSIGVVTPKIKKDTKDKDSSLSFGSGGQGGGSGGGPRGGGGQGGGPRGGGSGSRPSGPPKQDKGPEAVTIDFWFNPNFME
ncbi:hypothetical protein [Zobellia barbeyronii]|uniref:Uncharacterized protein n=1 Tax=Zobellia barbeyronii TaxID=2748009 RepID=A0ABS5WKR2_9FLAO|nr:hypothetical protein [Zobellia barbeyronii]MBT2162802.1 hypothetical protein [Zobellia barbeyronii]